MASALLPCTSLCFLIPSVYGFWTGHPVPAGILAFLAGSSVLYHATYHPTLYWIDQVALYVTTLSSFVYSYMFNPWLMILPSMGSVWNFFVYFYGSTTKQMVFHPVKEIGLVWHATIHIVSSFFYWLILFFISKMSVPLESSPA